MKYCFSCSAGDILLIEQVDRLSRLNEADWTKLKQSLNEKHIKVVALDLVDDGVDGRDDRAHVRRPSTT